MDHPYSWLKFVNAADLSGDPLDFDGLAVESFEGEHLGAVEGFIVNEEDGRPYYVVVDSGGWFKSKHFLLPIGHVRLESEDDAEAFVVDISRDRIDKFPGFRMAEFEKLSADDLKRFNDDTCAACSIDTVNFAAVEPLSATWERPDYTCPDWWQTDASDPERFSVSLVTAGAERNLDGTSATKPDVRGPFAGRAQPGDVVGIETGGERTYIGDTREDENARREEAEKSAAKKG